MGVDGRLFAPALHPAPMMTCQDDGQFEIWRSNVRKAVLEHRRRVRHRPVRGRPARRRCRHRRRRAWSDFVDGGKCLRSTFMYLGWLCGARAVSTPRCGPPPASSSCTRSRCCRTTSWTDPRCAAASPRHTSSSPDWHRDRGLSGCPERFGESAAVLLGDLCLVWAEQMLRDSGVDQSALSRAWPRYDAMRTELAVGQFADLVNDVGGLPTLDAVLDVARRKSGNYTVRRPLEIGAAMAGCDRHLLDAARRLRRRGRRGLPAARRPARHLRFARDHRQARRRRPVRAQGHQRRRRRPPAWPTRRSAASWPS